MPTRREAVVELCRVCWVTASPANGAVAPAPANESDSSLAERSAGPGRQGVGGRPGARREAWRRSDTPS